MSNAQEPLHEGAKRPAQLAGLALQTLGTRVALAALALANALVIARSLGPEGRGDIALVLTIADLTAILCLLGVQEANVNLAGTAPGLRRSLATNSLLLALGLGLVGIGAVTLLVAIFPGVIGDATVPLLAAALASIPFLIVNPYLRFLIEGDYAFVASNVSWLAPLVLSLTVNTTLALAGVLTVGAAVLVFLAGQVIASLVLVVFIAVRSVGFGRPDLSVARRTLTFGARSHVGRIMQTGNYRFDQWILGAMSGSRELGLYSIAVSWAEALFLLPTALASVQRPDLVRAQDEDAARLASRLFRISIVATAVFAVVLVVAAPLLCVVAFGEEFRGSIDDLRILALGGFGMVALKQLGNALIARQKPTLQSAAIGVAFAATVALDLLLIPRYGGAGAALASTIAYTVGGVVVAVLFVRSLRGSFGQLVPRASDVGWLKRRLSTLRPEAQ